ncbi:hypothetical protein RhiirA4_488323, partial [Rhizophagus irregularis]
MDLGKNLEYENLEENLEEENETFYSEYEDYNEYESLSNIGTGESLKSLFELDLNMLASAKKFAQQNISEEEDNWEDISDIGINFSEAESDEEHDEIIFKLQNDENLSPCVIIDTIDGKIQRCNSQIKLRRLWQMIGTWQIDEEEVKAKNFSIENLGVCYSHFLYDQNQLHLSNLKQTKNYTESIIHRRRCLFCNKNKIFFSRGFNCEEHSYTVIGKNIQVPCIGQIKCGALQTYDSFVILTKSSKRARYICMNCYEEKGGHIYQRVGRGVKKDPNCDNMSHHKNDTKKALEAIGYWILNISNSDKSAFQEKLLAHLTPILCIINTQEKSDTTLSTLPSIQNINNKVPSLFIILIILALAKFDYNFEKKLNPKNLTSKHFFEFGEVLAHSVILAKNELKNHKKILESPTSIEEYRTTFPACLVQFYDGLLITLYETKKKIVDQQRKHRKKPLKPLNYEKINKQVTFFVSIILNIAFKGWKIWLPRTMASLCRKPKLLSSLQGILEV